MSHLTEWLKFAPAPKPLKGNEKWNIFLSYRSVNRSWVLNLYDVLQESGYKVFLDQCVLKPGDQLVRKIEDGLMVSQFGILIWSKATRDSEWVQEEYQIMVNRNKKDPSFNFVVVKLDDSETPLMADNRIFIDFSSYPDGPNGGELLRLLYSINGSSMSSDAVHFAAAQDEAAKDAAIKVGAAVRTGNPGRIVDLFKTGGLPWETSASLGCKAAEALTKLNEYDKALEITDVLIKQFPKAVRPQQLKALALARRGSSENDLSQAQDILAFLYEKGERDPETLGIFARTWMDRFDKTGTIEFLRISRNYYAEAFESACDDYYTGINAAAKSVFLSTPEDLEKAKQFAADVQKIVGDKPYPGDYWKTATVAEVLLIQREIEKAAEMYKKAISIAPTETGSHNSSWRQASRLMEHMNLNTLESSYIKNAFGK
jgi:tetratricopeptide (TPR) repeat protein